MVFSKTSTTATCTTGRSFVARALAVPSKAFKQPTILPQDIYGTTLCIHSGQLFYNLRIGVSMLQLYTTTPIYCHPAELSPTSINFDNYRYPLSEAHCACLHDMQGFKQCTIRYLINGIEGKLCCVSLQSYIRTAMCVFKILLVEGIR